jgi:hypothetical protein
MTPNRIAVILTALAALCAGLAPVVADLDWESTAGIIAGISSITAVVYKWLDGWQKYEHDVRTPGTLPAPVVPPEEGMAVG